MDQYRREPTVKSIEEFIPSSVRIQQGGRVRNYVAAAIELLQNTGTVVVTGHGQAINKVVSVVEMVKRTNSVQSNVDIYSASETDVWKPLDEQLDTLQVTRHVPWMRITLTRMETETSF